MSNQSWSGSTLRFHRFVFQENPPFFLDDQMPTSSKSQHTYACRCHFALNLKVCWSCSKQNQHWESFSALQFARSYRVGKGPCLASRAPRSERLQPRFFARANVKYEAQVWQPIQFFHFEFKAFILGTGEIGIQSEMQEFCQDFFDFLNCNVDQRSPSAQQDSKRKRKLPLIIDENRRKMKFKLNGEPMSIDVVGS